MLRSEINREIAEMTDLVRGAEMVRTRSDVHSIGAFGYLPDIRRQRAFQAGNTPVER